MGASSHAATTINLIAEPAEVIQGGTSDITATVLDQNNELMPDGTVVRFSVSDETLGTIDEAAATVNGDATVVLTSSAGKSGTVTVTGSSGSASGHLDINVIKEAAP